MKLIIVIIILSSFNLYCQGNTDARMLALNGAYTTLATGYRSVGVNPANLGIYQAKSINFFNLSMGLNTNSLSISNYNVFNGANLEDSLDINYYPKSDFFNSFKNRGVRLMQYLILPLPGLNFSTKNIAITSSLKTNIDMGLPNGLMDLIFYGNIPGKSISIDMEQFVYFAEEIGASFAYRFKSFSAGISMKYILGLFYMGMESIDKPYIKTNISGFSGQNQYLIQQAIGGSGTGLDLGVTTYKSAKGYRFGISLINLIGKIKWTQDNFIREQLEPTLKNSSFYLRPNEFMYVNMVMDSVTGLSLSETSGEPLIYYEMYKVMPVTKIDIFDSSAQDSLIVPLDDGSYLYPSGGEYKRKVFIPASDSTFEVDDNYSLLSTGSNNQFITRQPMYFRIGFSREWDQQAIVAIDLVTGFSNRFNSSSSWKLAIASEIKRFNNKFLRIGYSFGGLAEKSISLGYAQKFSNIYIDFGVALNGGFSLDTAKGIDFAFGFIWQKNNNKN